MLWLAGFAREGECERETDVALSFVGKRVGLIPRRILNSAHFASLVWSVAGRTRLGGVLGSTRGECWMAATRGSLRDSASTTSLPPRLPSSSTTHHSPSSTGTAHSDSRRAAHSKQDPTLAELIRAEQGWDASTRPHLVEAATRTDEANAATKPHARRRSSAPLPDLLSTATQATSPETTPSIAVHPLPPVPPLLLPPHYGKPIRPSSPDAFACVPASVTESNPPC